MESRPHIERRISGIAALDQPLRRDLYRLLAERDSWVSRDEASEALGVPRSVAAFHLDKLVEAGVADVTFERTSGRTGPGAGRPAKLYRRSASEIAASIPERRYDLAGSLLASAVAESTRSCEPVVDCVSAAARAAGHTLGEQTAAPATGTGARTAPADQRQVVLDLLASQGYEPSILDDEIVMKNCPFHRLAEEHRNLVCGMNLDLLSGILEGLGVDRTMTARLAPEPGYCCVRITAT